MIRISTAGLICSCWAVGLCSTTAAAQVPSVSQSLEALSEEMGQLGTRLASQQAPNDERKGEISALQLLSAHTLMQADSAGLLAPHGSGWFKYGFYSLLGLAMADRAHGDRIYAVNAEAEFYSSKDLSTYDSLISTFNENWLARNIPNEVTKNGQFAYAFDERQSRYLAAERTDFAERVAENRRLRRTRTDSADLYSDPLHRVYDAADVDFEPVKFCAPWSSSESLDHPIRVSLIVSEAGSVEPNSVDAEGDHDLLPALRQYLAGCAFAPGRLNARAVRTRVTMIIEADHT